MTLLLLLPALLITFAGTVSDTAVTWLIQHRVLAPAAHSVIALPGGAGLDVARLMFMLGILVLLVAVRGRRRHRAAGHQPPATAP